MSWLLLRVIPFAVFGYTLTSEYPDLQNIDIVTPIMLENVPKSVVYSDHHLSEFLVQNPFLPKFSLDSHWKKLVGNFRTAGQRRITQNIFTRFDKNITHVFGREMNRTIYKRLEYFCKRNLLPLRVNSEITDFINKTLNFYKDELSKLSQEMIPNSFTKTCIEGAPCLAEKKFVACDISAKELRWKIFILSRPKVPYAVKSLRKQTFRFKDTLCEWKGKEQLLAVHGEKWRRVVLSSNIKNTELDYFVLVEDIKHISDETECIDSLLQDDWSSSKSCELICTGGAKSKLHADGENCIVTTLMSTVNASCNSTNLIPAYDFGNIHLNIPCNCVDIGKYNGSCPSSCHEYNSTVGHRHQLPTTWVVRKNFKMCSEWGACVEPQLGGHNTHSSAQAIVTPSSYSKLRRTEFVWGKRSQQGSEPLLDKFINGDYERFTCIVYSTISFLFVVVTISNSILWVIGYRVRDLRIQLRPENAAYF